MNWRFALTAALLVGALLSGWAVWRQRDVDTTTGPASGRPDYVLNDFELVALDERGREAFTLRAPTLTRDPAARSMDIAAPVFTIPTREGTGTPWTVRSATGWVGPEGEELRLRGDVRADSRDARGRTMRMDTQALDLFPERDLARSPVAVRVTQPGLILTGRRGAEAHLDTKRILLTDAHATYDPTAR